MVVRKFPYASPFRLYDATLIVITVQSILSRSVLAFCVLDSLLESIAPAHMSPNIELWILLLNLNSTSLLFPLASYLFGSSDSSLSNQYLIPNFNDYPSISSFFPPDTDTNTDVHISFSNPNSIFSPARSMSSSSDNSLYNHFANSWLQWLSFHINLFSTRLLSIEFHIYSKQTLLFLFHNINLSTHSLLAKFSI